MWVPPSSTVNYVRHAAREWITLHVLLALTTIWLSVSPSGQRMLEPLRFWLYDTVVSRMSPGESKVTVVAIDEASLAQLGRWPWRRAVHAAMLDTLAQAKPAVVGLDILLSEPTDDDATLLKAAGTIPYLVLAADMTDLASGSRIPVVPSATITSKTAEVSHVSVKVDSDGLVRGLNLAEGGFPAFSLAIAAKKGLPERFASLTKNSNIAVQSDQLSKGQWRSEHELRLPFSDMGKGLEMVSYGALLRGEVPSEKFKDRIVIVGAIATGLGDLHATPARDFANGSQLTPGVLIHANAVSTLINQREIHLAKPWLNTVVAVFFIAAGMSLMFRLSAGRSLIGMLGLILVAFAISAVVVWSRRIWIDPSLTVFISIIAYPLWSWRRLKAAVSGLAREADELLRLPTPWPSNLSAGKRGLDPSSAEALSDPLGQKLTVLSQASEQLRIANKFYADTLNQQAHPVLVVNEQSEVLFANSSARSAFTRLVEEPNGMTVNSWLQKVFPSLSLVSPHAEHVNFEAVDNEKRDWLVRLDRLSALPQTDLVVAAALGQISSRGLLQLVDISPLRATQRERDEAMRFLSHDIRSPQVALINWVASERKAGKLPESALAAVEQHSQHALEMADAFLRLARAENQDLVREELALSVLADEAADAAYETARGKSVKLTQSYSEDDVVIGDASMIRRAIINLIANAVNYGPGDSIIHIAVGNSKDEVWIDVCDQGGGVPAEEAEQVFKPYFRGKTSKSAAGTGLGLPFVKTVAQRHAGRVQIVFGGARYKDKEFSSIFRFALPKATLA